jgi:hypothetical protein
MIQIPSNGAVTDNARTTTAQSANRHSVAAFAALQNSKFLKTNAFVLQHRQTNHCIVQPVNPEEVTMSAVAEVSSKPRSASRGSDRPVCQVCADTMVVAEASAFLADNVVSHLWSCETCGYGFVTKHSLKPRSELTAA